MRVCSFAHRKNDCANAMVSPATLARDCFKMHRERRMTQKLAGFLRCFVLTSFRESRLSHCRNTDTRREISLTILHGSTKKEHPFRIADIIPNTMRPLPGCGSTNSTSSREWFQVVATANEAPFCIHHDVQNMEPAFVFKKAMHPHVEGKASRLGFIEPSEPRKCDPNSFTQSQPLELSAP